MKTTTNAKKQKETKKEGAVLKEVFVLWKKTSKNDLDYLSGMLSNTDDKKYLVGYYNTNKKNPKEPDIRIYILNEEGSQDHEIASLWTSESKNGTTYLTGLTDEKEKLVGFFGDSENETRPLIRVYIEEK